MMGGDSAIYAHFWPVLREELDKSGCRDAILYSDCLMIEEHIYGIKPWEYLDIDRFMLVCSFKGSNWQNMLHGNGNHDTFINTLSEAHRYINKNNVYFTVMEPEYNDLPRLKSIVGPENLDILNIVHYEVTKRRLEGII